MLNEDNKYRYVYRHRETGELLIKIRTIGEIEQGILSITYNDWELIARDRWLKELCVFENDICKCPITGDSADYLQLEAGDKDYVIRTVSIPATYQEGLPDNNTVIGNVHTGQEGINE